MQVIIVHPKASNLGEKKNKKKQMPFYIQLIQRFYVKQFLVLHYTLNWHNIVIFINDITFYFWSILTFPLLKSSV